ncbi:MAG: hypothetical protein B7Z02_15250 [Rhodobacterales bacterium 32-67-9]|nr:MAG: hypothetical protein B7Z02_15250 [Rhodobacterales bacterium 32-67-9]
MWVVARYDDVKAVLGNWQTLTTAKGVAMEPKVNEATSGPGRANSLTSDPPLHDEIRVVTGAPLRPGGLREIEPQVRAAAERLVDDLCRRKTVDGMVDVAQYLPMNLVREFVGLPDSGRENMLKWAAATVNAMGPMNDLGKSAIPQIQELHQYCINQAVPLYLKKDGWADRLYQAADAGKVNRDQCPGMMREYIGPALDTTIIGTGHLLRHLSLHRDQWEMLRADRNLIPAAINEALRMDSPVRSFTRYVRHDTDIGGTAIAEGDRVMVLYGSANRDELKFEGPDRFDITRANRDQIAFGHGLHTCGGMHLAKLEITALLEAMLDRIDYFETDEPTICLNNTLRGYEAMPMRVFAA